MSSQGGAFLTALKFLTRIPAGRGRGSSSAFHQSIAYFPLVGLLLGLLQAGAWQVLSYLVPPPARAGLVLALAVFLSGGLHLDGFIDTMDGLFSGRERERILAIMKDTHVGAHGVTAVVTLLIVKYSLLVALPPGGLWLASLPLPPLLVLAPLLSRWAMVPALTSFPYARKEGLGTIFGAGEGRSLLFLATLLAILFSWLVMGWPGMALLALAGLVALGWCFSLQRLLGGLTGDTYGALAELIEVVILAAGLCWLYGTGEGV